MLGNYFKIAFRNLLKFKAYSATNIIGLAIGISLEPYLQPFTKIHLYYNPYSGRLRTHLIIFTAIAFLILFIACINFINLSTARATKRTKEVGVRKVLGANRQNLIRQFLGESLFVTLLAFVPAFLLVELFLPIYQNLVGQQIFLYFSGLAIFLALLGLLGLAAFAAEQHTKEIGIRKVLGATVANVVALLSKDFVKLVLLANLLAWPVAWYAMNRWLQNFAYRITIDWWVFVLAGGLALLIALVTVSTQAIRAALANPVESLRYE